MEQAVETELPVFIHGEVELHGVPSSAIDEYWHLIAPMVQEALDKTGGNVDYDAEHLKPLCKERLMQLWVCVYNRRIIGTVVTEIQKFPKRKILSLLIVGAEKHTIHLWIQLIEPLRKYALEQGCDAVRGYGRPGWKRLLEKHVSDFSISFTLNV